MPANSAMPMFFPVVRQKCTYGNGGGGIVIWGSNQEMYVITYSLRVLD